MDDPELTLTQLGWGRSLDKSFTPFRAEGLEPGRVTVEDKHRYVVWTRRGEVPAHTAGKLLHKARSPAELPKVGDWVALAALPGEDKAVIHHVLPRRTTLSRKVPGRQTAEQVLATNIDTAFIVQALDRTFNLRLLQRHLLMVLESGAKPVVVLNKADLCENVLNELGEAERRAGNAPVIAVSAKTGEAMERLSRLIQPGETLVFIGPSGVGKSTLINSLYGEEIQATAEVRGTDFKGRHVTSWRELIVLPNGGLVIDTPGMREFHMWMADEGLREAFADIEELAVKCHFRDCTHTAEKKCAVLEAVGRGDLPRERYDNYLKLRNEIAYLEEARGRRVYDDKKRRARLAHKAFDAFNRTED